MSAFGDYKAYKKYEPRYASWKNNRDAMEARRLKYLHKNPDKVNAEDIQRGKALIRAIDVMDEYSQQRAEDMEFATEQVIAVVMYFTVALGMLAGAFVSKLKPVQNFLKKMLNAKNLSNVNTTLIPLGISALLSTVAAFPLYAWAAKTEVSASRRGRFEAMREDLKNPSTFAILSEDQIKEAKQKSKNIKLKKEKKSRRVFETFTTLKKMVSEDNVYKKQRQKFNAELAEAEKHLNDKMTPQEIENAKKDQQLLTKIIEEIDIASQDYAENAELATGTAIAALTAFGALFALGIDKLLNLCKIKTSNKTLTLLQIGGFLAPAALAFSATQIQKQASRVGRYKVKQDMLKNPEKLVYVSDENALSVGNVKVNKHKKEGYFTFLKNLWKNNKEYNEYKKTVAKEEEKFYKAIEHIKLNPQQAEEAKTLQRNTFKTFNKIDENSQKYSESVEALASAVQTPIAFIFQIFAAMFGAKYLDKAVMAKNEMERILNGNKYFAVIIATVLPMALINAYVTKEQKKASRIADMRAIEELKDYRRFR